MADLLPEILRKGMDSAPAQALFNALRGTQEFLAEDGTLDNWANAPAPAPIGYDVPSGSTNLESVAPWVSLKDSGHLMGVGGGQIVSGLRDQFNLKEGEEGLQQWAGGMRDMQNGMLNVAMGGAEMLGPGAKILAPFAVGAGSLYALNKMAGTEVSDLARMFPSQAGSIAGKSAKTADIPALELAKKMKKAGKPRKQIWKETGWFQAVDGEWKFEIDDSASVLIGSPGAEGAAQRQVLYHPDLYDAYPDMEDIMVSENKRGPQGVYNPTNDSISIKKNLSAYDTRSTNLHELQHGIQSREDFARGSGGYNSGFIGDEDEIYKLVDWDEVSPIMEKYDIAGDNLGMYPSQFLEEIFNTARNNGAPYDELRLIKREIGKVKDAENLPENIRTPYQAWEMYAKTAGEAEARAVQKRMDMSAAERKQRPFWEDYDVLENDQTVNFSDTQIMEAARKPTMEGYYDDASAQAADLKKTLKQELGE